MKHIFRLNLVVMMGLLFFSFECGFAQGGGAAVPFLRIAPDARSSGMGEVGTAIADDINAIFWNPAGLAYHDFINPEVENDRDLIPYRQIALSFSPWLPQFHADLFYSYATFGHFFEDLDGTVAFNFIFMNLGEFTRTDETGKILGKFISNEFSLGLSYGTIIAPDLGIGFQLRYIQSNLAPINLGEKGAGIGISGGFDLGILWKPQTLNILGLDLGDRIALGANLQNIGPKVTYKSESDPLPTTLRLGTAVTFVKDEFNDLKIAFDISKLLVRRDTLSSDPLPISLITGWKNPGFETSVGAEYWYEIGRAHV